MTEKDQKVPTWLSPKYRFVRSAILFVVVGFAAYFINVEIQTFLGKRALASTGLKINSFEAAKNIAEKSNKYVLADISAIWCPTCRKLDTEIFANEEVKRALDRRFVFARLEYESDEGKAFTKQYQVRGFPTLLVLSSKGEKLRQLPVIFEPDAFIEQLKSVP